MDTVNLQEGDADGRNIIEGRWKELKGHAREQWGKLSDDELEEVGGKKDRLVGGVSVLLLQLADEAILLAPDFLKLVVAELAPLFPRMAFELFPLALDDVPVHLRLPPASASDSIILHDCRHTRRGARGNWVLTPFAFGSARLTVK